MKVFRSLEWLVVALSAAVLGGAATAAPAESTGPALSKNDYIDLLYDFDLYVGQPQFGWVVVFELVNGNHVESAPFNTEHDAAVYASIKTRRRPLPKPSTQEVPENIVGYEIVYKEVEPTMEFFATYDTLSTAEHAANYFESYGYYTDIEFVSLYSWSIQN